MVDKYDDERAPFDIMGYGLLAFGMAAISLSLDGLSGRGGVEHAWVLLLLVFGLIAIVAYWLRATRQADPLFAPSLFKIPSFSIGLLGNLFARLGSSSMPFLTPLLLQLSLGFSPSHAGLMMIPAATAGVFVKNLAPPLIRRHGYRKVLVVNTVLVGLTMASYSLISPNDPIWVQLLLMTMFGTVNSLQFTAMNTVTLKDLGQHGASSGNSMLSMVQMLAMSLAVTAAGAILSAFTELAEHETADSTLTAFRGTFLCVGLITAASAWIFAQLAPDDKTAGRRTKSPEEVG
jgi:MFS family permease